MKNVEFSNYLAVGLFYEEILSISLSISYAYTDAVGITFYIAYLVKFKVSNFMFLLAANLYPSYHYFYDGVPSTLRIYLS